MRASVCILAWRDRPPHTHKEIGRERERERDALCMQRTHQVRIHQFYRSNIASIPTLSERVVVHTYILI